VLVIEKTIAGSLFKLFEMCIFPNGVVHGWDLLCKSCHSS